MYKILGAGLLGLFALLAVPAIQEDIQTTYMGGMVTVTLYDSFGEELMFQQVHNRIVDTGENMLVDTVFADGTLVADADQVGVICPYILLTQDINPAETNATAAFITSDENSGGGAAQCIGRINVDTSAAGTAVVGTDSSGAQAGYNFQGGNGNDAIGTGDLLRGIGVFTGSINATDPTGLTLFAIINTNDVTVGADDTVNIKYTFDITDLNN